MVRAQPFGMVCKGSHRALCEEYLMISALRMLILHSGVFVQCYYSAALHGSYSEWGKPCMQCEKTAPHCGRVIFTVTGNVAFHQLSFHALLRIGIHWCRRWIEMVISYNMKPGVFTRSWIYLVSASPKVYCCRSQPVHCSMLLEVCSLPRWHCKLDFWHCKSLITFSKWCISTAIENHFKREQGVNS